MTRVQEPTGRIATFWVRPKVIPGDPMGPGGRYPYNGWVDWINCMISDIFALEELADVKLEESGIRASGVRPGDTVGDLR